jgi:hypothetical protein
VAVAAARSKAQNWPVTDVVGLHALIEEYGRLKRLEDHTAQSRGQRFNGLIAEMLKCFGIDARASVMGKGKGEIDVVFAIGATRYVLEAKWGSRRQTPATSRSCRSGSGNGSPVRAGSSFRWQATLLRRWRT